MQEMNSYWEIKGKQSETKTITMEYITKKHRGKKKILTSLKLYLIAGENDRRERSVFPTETDYDRY